MDNKVFKSQTFNLAGEEYLYQIHIKGQNSLVKLYNNSTQLRSTQRIRLPANSDIYPVQNYLVALSQNQIQLFMIPNVIKSAKCRNPNIKRINLICYNKQANLILFVDNLNILYYLMLEADSLKVKKLYDCHSNGITAKTTKIAVDHESDVHLFSQENNTVYTLRFDWNKGDKIMHVLTKTNIIDIYCRFKWTVWVEEESQGFNKIRIYNNESEQYYKNMSLIKQRLIIKATPQDLLIANPLESQIILIRNGQCMHEKDLDINFGGNPNASSLLFEVKKIKLNTFNLILHYFPNKIQQPFQNVQIPIKQIAQIQPLQSVKLYIHNNIHLILTQKGLTSHFENRVIQFLDLQQNIRVGDDKLACQLICKLLIQSPYTLTKLVSHFSTLRKKMHLPSQLRRYISYIQQCLNNICDQILALMRESKNAAKQYQKFQGFMRNIVKFAGILYTTVKSEQNKNNNYTHSMNEEYQINDIYFYYKILQRCKVIYLLNQIMFQHLKYPGYQQSRSMINQGDHNTEDISKREYEQIQQSVKIGKYTCHQIFGPNIGRRLNIDGVIKYLAKCQNFYHAAYFYLYFGTKKQSIPYIGDNQTYQLIKFLVSSPLYSVLSNRPKSRQVFKNLPKMTGKALLLNEPSFLQYLCSLSVNISEYKCCLAILLTKVWKQWPESTIDFVCQCLILSDEVRMAYDLVDQIRRKQQQRVFVQKFINFCVKQKKVKELIDISKNSPYQKQINNSINMAFKDDIQEIRQLMSQLSN